MFAYSGWNAASYVAEEIREPGRNVPRALGIGTAAVVLVYLGLNVLYLYAVPIGEIGTAQLGDRDGGGRPAARAPPRPSCSARWSSSCCSAA